MPTIKLAAFAGEQPRVLARLMRENTAQSAINCRLDDGALTPHRIQRLDYTFPSMPDEGYDTIYRHQSEWLGWTSVVHAAPGPVDDTRLYYTGDGVPKVRTAGGTVYNLAVPFPSGALTGTLGGTGAGDITTRLYVYTWVTSLGEESEPNPASNELNWQPGNSVTLSGFVTAPAGRGITKQRIYRSQTGSAGTNLYFIAERADTNANYVDTIPIDTFAEVLPSRNWNAPPDDMAGLIPMPNGIMAAFSGKKICFCEPFHPHAWPESYQLTTDFPIVGLAAIGQVLIVLTEANPYIVSGSDPASMYATKLETNLPCINGRSIVDLGFAIAYASHEGLVVVDGSGAPNLVTREIFNRDDWLALNPSIMISAQYSGNYIASYTATDEDGTPISGSLIMDLAKPLTDLIRSDTAPVAWFYEVQTGSLFFREAELDGVYEFDPSSGARKQQYWKSKEFVLPIDMNFGAILIDTKGNLTPQEIAANDAAIAAAIAANAAMIAAGTIGGAINEFTLNGDEVNGDNLVDIPNLRARNCTVNVYCDGVLMASVSKTDRVARLPSKMMGRRWEIDASGDVRIEQIVMARTVDELRQAV